jgi:hypothetical protein
MRLIVRLGLTVMYLGIILLGVGFLGFLFSGSQIFAWPCFLGLACFGVGGFITIIAVHL